ncbi:TniQ family protein [Pseudomonas sp. NPDC077186]|uniref:TniQ family protein n=1 Tax=Pseudomonas sp. NPDC077186 TaxID=3364421 RepID=UPI0037C8ACEF
MSFFQSVNLKPGESLNSLLMRKAELNGYGTAHALLADVGMTMKVSYLPEEPERLRACFELTEHDLMPASAGQAPYLGQKAFLRSQCSPVCPQCLADEGVAQEAWSHVLVIACHKHQTELLSQCPQCAEPICLTRRALMHCDCGYEYCHAISEPASAFSAGLSALLENVDAPSRQALPLPLHQLSFEPLLPAFLLMLAKAQGRMSDQLPPKFRFAASSSFEDSVAMVGYLESLLGEWPHCFDDVLEDLLIQGEGVSLAGRIGTWYRELFSTYAAPSFDFLRDRFKAQVAEHFDGRLGVSARAQMFGAGNADAMQWFSAAEAARLLGVAPDILANLVITQQIQGKVHQEGKSRFIVVHRATLDQIAADRASYLSATEARQRLNVSKNFFERFIQAGGLRRYKRSERPVLVAGEFRVADVDQVIQQLVGCVRKKPRAAQLIGIQDISAKHGISNSKIASVLQDILQGIVRPVAHISSLAGLAGLQFNKTEIEQRVRDNDPDVVLSVDELAQVSGWKPGVIKKWIQGGYLKSIVQTHGRAERDVIQVSALIEFLLTYSPTAELSKQLKTKTLYLTKTWRSAKIEVITPPQDSVGGQRGLLVRNADLALTAQLRKPTIRELADQYEDSTC